MRDRCDRLIGHAGECGSARQAQASAAPASPWVRASERRPPLGALVPTRVEGGAWCGRMGFEPIYSGLEWLDLDAVDRLAGENAELREKLGAYATAPDVIEAEDLRRQVQSGADEITRLREELEAEKRAHAAWMRSADTWHRTASQRNEELDDLRARLAEAESAARDAADRLAAYATPKHQ